MKDRLLLYLVISLATQTLFAHSDQWTIPTEFEFTYTFENPLEPEKEYKVSGSVTTYSDMELNFLKVTTGGKEIEVPAVALNVEGKWRRPIWWKPDCRILRPGDYGTEEDIGFYLDFEYEQSGKEAFTQNESGKRKLHMRYLFLLGSLAEVNYTIHEESAPGSKRWEIVDSGKYHPGDKGFSKKGHVSTKELMHRMQNAEENSKTQQVD